MGKTIKQGICCSKESELNCRKQRTELQEKRIKFYLKKGRIAVVKRRSKFKQIM